MKKRIAGINHFTWIGMLTSVIGLLSYFFVFARFAVLRDFPWINIPLVIIGVLLSLWAILRRLNLWSIGGAVLSVFSAALLIFYVFVLSAQLPTSEGVVAVGENAPPFSLIADNGDGVTLDDFGGANIAVVFYRGFW